MSASTALPRLNRPLRIAFTSSTQQQFIYCTSQPPLQYNPRRVVPRRLPWIRLYTSGSHHPTGNQQPLNPGDSPSTTISNRTRGSKVRHEAQEGNLAINLPFNPPGNGGGSSFGGGSDDGSLWSNNPLASAALTTVIGLGMGKSILPHKCLLRHSAHLYVSALL